MSTKCLSAQRIKNSQSASRSLLVRGRGACQIVLILMALVSTTRSQSAEEPLFGITFRNAAFEQRFVQTRTERDGIAKVILNSNVHGEQTTTTETRLRIFPDPGNIRFDVITTGNVTSETTSINREVTIDGVGRHHFEITKPFWFDGSSFLTQPGHGTIQANQFPRRVVSAVGAAMPLLSPLTDRIAWQQVSQRQAQINQAVAEDVAGDVLPKINRIADEEFARLSQQLARVRTQAEATLKDIPVRWVASSTVTTFSIAAVTQKKGFGQTAFNAPAVAMPPLAAGEEVAFTISESVATALLQKYVPGGLMLTDTQVKKAAKAWNSHGDEKWSVSSLLQLAGDLERYSGAKPSGFSIEMARVRPVAVRFDRGDVCIETAFQIVPAQGAPSGGMKLTFRMHGRGISADQWAVALQSVDMGDAEHSESISSNKAKQLGSQQGELRIPVEGDVASGDVASGEADAARPEITTVEAGTSWFTVVKSIAQSLVEKIPPATLPREFDMRKSLPGLPKLRLVRIESADGVLRAAFRLVDGPDSPIPLAEELQRPVTGAE